jgi:sulfur relay (sulfurtransferase) DsrF/TusC family protein
MAKRVLNIVASAYRATLEEQDDTVVWLAYTMKSVGADMDVLLRGNAVNYAVHGQNASGLAFGDERQTQPPRIEEDLGKLISAGVRVFLVDEDLTERGVERADLIAGVEPIARAGLPGLLGPYDQVWHW